MLIKKNNKLMDIQAIKKSNLTPYKQQTLDNWRPNANVGTLLPVLLVVSIIAFPVGLSIYYVSSNIQEISTDYTDCLEETNNSSLPQRKCSEVINKDNFHVTCVCKPIEFVLKKPLEGQAYIFYALTNFYQNHLHYKRSQDDIQLRGLTGTIDKPSLVDTNCHPFDYDGSKVILPCGAVANSMFMDEIKLFKGDQEIPLRRTGIAMDIDKKYKFKNPSWFLDAKNDPSHPAWSKFTKPKAWKMNLWELENGIENEDLIVWMRIAAFPNFRKLYRFVEHNNSDAAALGIREGLPAGKYYWKVNYSFPVTIFSGTKSIVIAANSFIAGKNDYIGPAYLAVGVSYLLICFIFLLIYLLYKPNKIISTHRQKPSSKETVRMRM